MKAIKSSYTISKIDGSELTEIEAEELNTEISKAIGKFKCWSTSLHLPLNK